jgi:hypothetical protein
MIFSAPTGYMYDGGSARFAGEHQSAAATFEAVPAGSQPDPEFFWTAGDGVQSRIESAPIPVTEEFDWSVKKTNREFILLEQKSLAKKASKEEVQRYKLMKKDRDSLIFSDRYISDYAEIQRLKILSEKIAEIQKYLRPIKTG